MPRYTSRQSFQPLKSVHRQTVCLRGLSNDHYKLLQDAAKTASHPDIHDQAFRDIARADRMQLIHGLWEEHHARRRGEPTGGGLGDAFNWLGKKVWSPIKHVWNGAKNYYHYFAHENTISDHTRLVARGIQQTYNKKKDDRLDQLGTFKRVEELSTDWLDVWKDAERDQILVTCRGSRDPVDFAVDDLAILAGHNPRDLVSSQLRDIFQRYGDDYEIELAGHSLGSSLLATALANNSDLKPFKMDFFNPGTNPWPGIEDAVKSYSSDDRAHYFVNAIDPVSLGEMGESPSNLIINSPQSWVNPVSNHAIDQWIDHD